MQEEDEDIFCEGIVLLRLERPIKTAGINYVIPSPFIRENFSDYYTFALVAFLSPEIVFVPCARICLRLRRLFSVLFPVCGSVSSCAVPLLSMVVPRFFCVPFYALARSKCLFCPSTHANTLPLSLFLSSACSVAASVAGFV